jgi:hypothetical protein
MKRFLMRLFRLSTLNSQRSTRKIIDVPAEFGERMRLMEVRALCLDPRMRPMINAMAQVLLMNRRAAEERARDAAVRGLQKEAAFHLGEMEAVNNVLADVQRLTEDERGGGSNKWGGSEEMKVWFRGEGV